MALGCDTSIREWQAAHQLPVYPGQTNVWTLRIRAPEDATTEELLEHANALFARWLPLFGGLPVSMPNEHTATSTPIATLDTQWQNPSHSLTVAFRLGQGTLTRIAWPIHTANRRARKAPDCPDPPIDSGVSSVYAPTGPYVVFGQQVAPRANPNDPDSLDVGLPQIDTDALRRKGAEIVRALQVATAVVLVLAGVVVLRRHR